MSSRLPTGRWWTQGSQASPSPSIADRSLHLLEAGSAAVLVFMKGDVLVTLNATSGIVGQSELDALVTTARTMDERL